MHRAQLWRNAPYVATHQNVKQIIDAGGILVATSAPLITTVSASGMAMILGNVEFGSIAEGPVIPVMTIAQTSGPEGGGELPQDQQRLVCFLNRGRNLPLTPSGRPVDLEGGRVFQA